MKALLKKFTSKSLVFEISEIIAHLRELIKRAMLWHWTIERYAQYPNSSFDILYLGRKVNFNLIKRLIGVADVNKIAFNISKHTVFITEIPLPGSLCIPQYLRAIVALDRTIEEILENYDDKLRRSLLKNRKRYRLKQTTDETVIDFADRKMLQPFAAARHGTSANQMSSDTVRRFALEFGRLDLVLLDDEVVACMLGVESIRKGKRYWVADRCGYPENVFSNPKLLSELNSINPDCPLEALSNMK